MTQLDSDEREQVKRIARRGQLDEGDVSVDYDGQNWIVRTVDAGTRQFSAGQEAWQYAFDEVSEGGLISGTDEPATVDQTLTLTTEATVDTINLNVQWDQSDLSGTPGAVEYAFEVTSGGTKDTTTTTGAVSVGDHTVDLSDVSNVAEGDMLVVSDGTAFSDSEISDTAVVESISGSTVTLDDCITHDQASGASVDVYPAFSPTIRDMTLTTDRANSTAEYMGLKVEYAQDTRVVDPVIENIAIHAVRFQSCYRTYVEGGRISRAQYDGYGYGIQVHSASRHCGSIGATTQIDDCRHAVESGAGGTSEGTPRCYWEGVVASGGRINHVMDAHGDTLSTEFVNCRVSVNQSTGKAFGVGAGEVHIKNCHVEGGQFMSTRFDDTNARIHIGGGTTGTQLTEGIILSNNLNSPHSIERVEIKDTTLEAIDGLTSGSGIRTDSNVGEVVMDNATFDGFERNRYLLGGPDVRITGGEDRDSYAQNLQIQDSTNVTITGLRVRNPGRNAGSFTRAAVRYVDCSDVFISHLDARDDGTGNMDYAVETGGTNADDYAESTVVKGASEASPVQSTTSTGTITL